MTKQEFKEQFITQFLATYAANIYADCCSNAEHDKLYNLPVEDAEDIAEKTWELSVNAFFERNGMK